MPSPDPVIRKALLDAATVCQNIQRDLAGQGALEKKDFSPVTLADFASQILIIKALRTLDPQCRIVAEEDSKDLRSPENQELLGQLTTFLAAVDGPQSPDEILHLLDQGNDPGGSEGTFWTIDPIDGTKGYLRGDQYAIALGQVSAGTPTLGWLVCPNLPFPNMQSDQKGCLFHAVASQGTWIAPLDAPECLERCTSSHPEPRFCQPFEAAHSAQDKTAPLGEALGLNLPPYCLDSQAKYGVVARGEASLYLRIPRNDTYKEKIWDHAAGAIVLAEAGALIADCNGRPLDFSLGQTLSANRGIVAGPKEIVSQAVDFLASTKL